jgi:hypothetical protein
MITNEVEDLNEKPAMISIYKRGWLQSRNVVNCGKLHKIACRKMNRPETGPLSICYRSIMLLKVPATSAK